jgi:hypothetical protein
VQIKYPTAIYVDFIDDEKRILALIIFIQQTIKNRLCKYVCIKLFLDWIGLDYSENSTYTI